MSARQPKSIAVKILRLSHAADLPLPAYQTADAAGVDLVAANHADQPVVLAPGERRLVPTGLAVQLPAGMEAQVRPRSGLALKHGVTVLNSPGTIDADYRGEVGVILINHGAAAFHIARGDRIAQMVFAPVTRVRLTETRVLTKTERGSGGFGSTGSERTKNSNEKKPSKSISPASRGRQTKPSRSPR